MRRPIYRQLAAILLAILLLATSHYVLAQNGDTEPPRLVAFDFEPKTVDVALGGQYITFTLRITDETGLMDDSIGPEFAHLSDLPNPPYEGGTIGPRIITVEDRVAGDARDGIYVGRLFIWEDIRGGVYRFYRWGAMDMAGNVGWLYYEDMMELGFPTVFTVTDNSLYLPVVLNSASD